MNYQPALDTITNTESDTIAYSFPPNRNFDFVWTLQATGISGTDSLNVRIEESACNTCSTWLLVGSADVLGGTSTANRVAWTSGQLYGLRQRIIITGIGTQSTSYRVYATFRRRQ